MAEYTADELAAITLLARELGGRLIYRDEHPGWPQCPDCGALRPPTDGPTLRSCYVCSYRQAGGTEYDNAVRIEFGLSWSRYWAKVELHGLPWQSPREWRASQARLRRTR